MWRVENQIYSDEMEQMDDIRYWIEDKHTPKKDSEKENCDITS